MINVDSFRSFVTKVANYEDREIVEFLKEWLKYFESLERVAKFCSFYEESEEVKYYESE